MYAEIFALLTAMLRGLSSIPTKRGLEHSNPNTSAFTYLLFNTVFLWIMTAVLYPLDRIRIEGFGYFVLAGICAPGLARMFRDTGLKRLGVTISSPIVSTNTLFSVLIAVSFLGEEITVFIVAGAFIIFAGVNLITWRNGNTLNWNKRDVIFPLTAAFFFALSTNLRKMGLNQMEFPIAGAAITSTVSLTSLVCSLIVARQRNSMGMTLKLNNEAVKHFSVASVISSLAYLFYFLALSASRITRIQPIAGTNPLWAILFSYIFLRETERITMKIVLGTVLIVLGVALIFI